MRLITRINHGEEVVALVNEANIPMRFFISRPERLNLEDVLPGIIRKKDSVLKGYFVETQKHAVFVPSKDTHTEGERVWVKITKEARQGKDANGIFITESDFIAHTSSDSLSQKLSNQLSLPISYDWDSSFDEALDEALAESVSLSNGLKIHINRTSTCWTIDVDSTNATDSFKALNYQAAEIIVQEILKRHIGGLILIDFIGTKHKSLRIALQKYLTELLEKDNLSQILGWTHGGLFEIRRTRTYAPLIDVFLDIQGNPTFLSTAYRICTLVDACKTTPYITAHPKVIDILRDKLKNIACLKADITYPLHHFDIKEK